VLQKLLISPKGFGFWSSENYPLINSAFAIFGKTLFVTVFLQLGFKRVVLVTTLH
jgi:hypothetical protein